MCEISQNSLTASLGRIRLNLTWKWLGDDLLICVAGGKKHIGSVAFCEPGATSGALEAAGHKEGELAGAIAAKMAASLDCKVAVVCGIHYDDIDKKEIELILGLAHELAELACKIISTGQNNDHNRPA